MRLVIDKQDKYTLICPEEEKIDSLLAPELKSEVVYQNAEGAKNIIMDLSKVNYIDSSGLSAILVANRLCKNNNGTFVLTGLQAPVKKLVEISQLDSILSIVPTLNEAIDFVFMEEVEREFDNE